MSYPPTIPPATRLNETPQADNHPGDHNALSTGLTDVVNELGANPSGTHATVQARFEAATLWRGVGAFCTGQEFTALQAADIIWSGEAYDEGSWYTAPPPTTSITVPADGAGIVAVTLSLQTSTPVSGNTRVAIQLPSQTRATYIPAGQTIAGVTHVGAMQAGVIITANLWSGHTGSMFVSGSIEVNLVARPA